jgi:thiol-disulfide isomerase/thioredoxin
VPAAWLHEPDFQYWVATRVNYFVKLADDGRLQIPGVEPGKYDLVIQLYEQPAGCLVETIGEKVIPITIAAEQADAGNVDLGQIEVTCRTGPRVGSDMRAFQVTDASGQVRFVDDMQGQYVLFHAWATWCAPCLESMPQLKMSVERHADASLTVIGLNLDENVAAAKQVAEAQQMDWAQNYLGRSSDLMRQLAISSAPAYFLIGPDGKLIGSANQWEEMEQLLSRSLE